MAIKLSLRVLPEGFGVVRLAPTAGVPEWALRGELSSVTRTEDELSLICRQDLIPPDFSAMRDFYALKVQGPLAFSEVGVLDSLAHPLAIAGISIFALSTFDTDYILVSRIDLAKACSALSGVGHEVNEEGAA
jgi:hypothetical protein